jgi:ornithine carbamoyltransferase
MNARNFLDIDDLSADEVDAVLARAAALKNGDDDTHLADQTLGMLFEKPSTRTRISFETGMTQLGGHAIFMGPDDIQLGHGEPLKDTARAMGRYVDGIMARLFSHEDAEILAEYADVPVINGLTDDAHPCQTLADLLTIRERFDDDVSVAWVGDGNNVACSLALICAMLGLRFTLACPDGYELDADWVRRIREAYPEAQIERVQDAREAASDADFIYTDVWTSMGQEAEREQRRQIFADYRVDQRLLEAAGPQTRVMHCLPAIRGEEITNEVIDGPQSVIVAQAGNRMHAQKGLLVWMLDGEWIRRHVEV